MNEPTKQELIARIAKLEAKFDDMTWAVNIMMNDTVRTWQPHSEAHKSFYISERYRLKITRSFNSLTNEYYVCDVERF
jgi:hypothetical protein